jgi:hypothetical protein
MLISQLIQPHIHGSQTVWKLRCPAKMDCRLWSISSYDLTLRMVCHLLQTKWADEILAGQ